MPPPVADVVTRSFGPLEPAAGAASDADGSDRSPAGGSRGPRPRRTPAPRRRRVPPGASWSAKTSRAASGLREVLHHVEGAHHREGRVRWGLQGAPARCSAAPGQRRRASFTACSETSLPEALPGGAQRLEEGAVGAAHVVDAPGQCRIPVRLHHAGVEGELARRVLRVVVAGRPARSSARRSYTPRRRFCVLAPDAPARHERPGCSARSG